MAKRASRNTRTNDLPENTSTSTTEQTPYRYCAVPLVPERLFSYDMNPHRARLIQIYSKKWVNGTVLHYYFFDRETDGQYLYGSSGRREWQPWTSSEADSSRS